MRRAVFRSLSLSTAAMAAAPNTAQCGAGGAQQRRAMAGGPPQVPDIILPSWGTHKASLIFLPGWRETARVWYVSLEGLREYSPNTRIIIPTAPLAFPEKGGLSPSWFDFQKFTPDAVRDPPRLEEACARVAELVHQERRRVGPQGRVLLCGFQQGGGVALHTGIREQDAVSDIITLSAFLPAPDALKAAMTGITPRSDLYIHMAHGKLDPLIPAAWTEASRAHLRGMGYHLHTWAHDYGHGMRKRVYEKFAEVVHMRVHGEHAAVAAARVVDGGGDPEVMVGPGAYAHGHQQPRGVLGDGGDPTDTSGGGYLAGDSGWGGEDGHSSNSSGGGAVVPGGVEAHRLAQWGGAEYGEVDTAAYPPAPPPGHRLEDIPLDIPGVQLDAPLGMPAQTRHLLNGKTKRERRNFQHGSFTARDPKSPPERIQRKHERTLDARLLDGASTPRQGRNGWDSPPTQIPRYTDPRGRSLRKAASVPGEW